MGIKVSLRCNAAVEVAVGYTFQLYYVTDYLASGWENYDDKDIIHQKVEILSISACIPNHPPPCVNLSDE